MQFRNLEIQMTRNKIMDRQCTLLYAKCTAIPEIFHSEETQRSSVVGRARGRESVAEISCFSGSGDVSRQPLQSGGSSLGSFQVNRKRRSLCADQYGTQVSRSSATRVVMEKPGSFSISATGTVRGCISADQWWLIT